MKKEVMEKIVSNAYNMIEQLEKDKNLRIVYSDINFSRLINNYKNYMNDGFTNDLSNCPFTQELNIN